MVLTLLALVCYLSGAVVSAVQRAWALALVAAGLFLATLAGVLRRWGQQRELRG